LTSVNPDIEKLRDDRFKELDGLNADLKLIDPSDTTKQSRVKRKDLEKKIALAEDFTLKCDETIVVIRDNTNKENEKVDQLLARIKFAEDYGSTKIKITELRRAEYNPRIMPENEMSALKTSIKTFGFVESVVVNTHTCDQCGDRKWVLVGGHQRTTAVEGLVAQGEPIRGIETRMESPLFQLIWWICTFQKKSFSISL